MNNSQRLGWGWLTAGGVRWRWGGTAGGWRPPPLGCLGGGWTAGSAPSASRWWGAERGRCSPALSECGCAAGWWAAGWGVQSLGWVGQIAQSCCPLLAAGTYSWGETGVCGRAVGAGALRPPLSCCHCFLVWGQEGALQGALRGAWALGPEWEQKDPQNGAWWRASSSWAALVAIPWWGLGPRSPPRLAVKPRLFKETTAAVNGDQQIQRVELVRLPDWLQMRITHAGSLRPLHISTILFWGGGVI